MVIFSDTAPDAKSTALLLPWVVCFMSQTSSQHLQCKTQMCPMLILNEYIATDASLTFY